jgi:hypothetical protein
MQASGQFHALTALTHEKLPRYPMDRSLDGRQSRSGRGVEEKKYKVMFNVIFMQKTVFKMDNTIPSFITKKNLLYRSIMVVLNKLSQGLPTF